MCNQCFPYLSWLVDGKSTSNYSMMVISNRFAFYIYALIPVNSCCIRRSARLWSFRARFNSAGVIFASSITIGRLSIWGAVYCLFFSTEVTFIFCGFSNGASFICLDAKVSLPHDCVLFFSFCCFLSFHVLFDLSSSAILESLCRLTVILFFVRSMSITRILSSKTSPILQKSSFILSIYSSETRLIWQKASEDRVLRTIGVCYVFDIISYQNEHWCRKRFPCLVLCKQPFQDTSCPQRNL